MQSVPRSDALSPQDDMSLSGREPGAWAQHQGQSIAQLRARPLPRNLLSCQQMNTSWNNLPACCTWISTWKTGTIADCKDQRRILQRTSLAICLGVHWLWILGEGYSIALMISYLTCFMYDLSVCEFGCKYENNNFILVYFLQFTIFKGLANSLSYKIPSKAIVRHPRCSFFFGIHRIIECFVLEGIFRGHLAQPPCSEQGQLQLHQVAQRTIQPGLEIHQTLN